MKIFFRLALASLLNRKGSVSLCLVAMALSVTLFLSIEKINSASRSAFLNTITNVDLIIGAKGGSLQLLLYSVFRIGQATNNMSWESYQELTQNQDIAWSIPISLGDSHRGHRVIGTDENYLNHYEFAQGQKLQMKEGRFFQGNFEVVLGSKVAKRLGYQLGDQITLSHGVSDNTMMEHRDRPFIVTGVFEATNTPVDESLHVSLGSIEAIHIDWDDGVAPLPGDETPFEELKNREFQPSSITAAFVGLENKFGIFRLKRAINDYREESLMAVLPGAVFQQLWKTVSLVERVLKVVSFFALFVGTLGLIASLLSSVNERRRELAIFRAIGISPYKIFFLICGESSVIALFSAVLGVAFAFVGFEVARPFLSAQLGLNLPFQGLTSLDLILLPILGFIGFIVGALPAWRSYRQTLADGLSMRL